MKSTCNLEHSPSISKATKLTVQLAKKKAKEHPGPGPANYNPDNYDQYIKSKQIVPAKPKKPSIDRLSLTLKLYDPNWQKGMIGTQSSEEVSPSSYKPKLFRKPSPVKFTTQKTNRGVIKVEDFGPSPQSYDLVSGLSMCSSLEKSPQ